MNPDRKRPARAARAQAGLRRRGTAPGDRDAGTSAAAPRPLQGSVLAGGASRRMGTDKALIFVAGEPLWQRQVHVLRASAAEPVTIVRRPDQPRLCDHVTHVHDLVQDAGPLAGLHAALTSMISPWLAVLAVDLPAIDAVWFNWLWKHCASGCGAVARHAGRFEPLAAIYPQAAIAIAEEHLRRQELSLQRFVAALIGAGRIKVLELPPTQAWRTANGNTHTGLAMAVALSRRPNAPGLR